MSQNNPLKGASNTQNTEASDSLRALTDRLTKECDHDVELIRQGTASSIRELENRIKELKSVERAKIDDRKHRLGQQIERLKTGVPIQKLPTEILSYIFCFHSQLDQSPWCLLEVCKHWRRLATRTPQLWCRIQVMDAASQLYYMIYPRRSDGGLDGVKMTFDGNSIICVNIAQVQAALRLSGAVPLTVRITSYSPQCLTSSTTVLATSLLLDEPYCRRIETLNIYFPHNSTFPILSTTPSLFGLLRSIKFNGPVSVWWFSLFRAISSTLSGLRQVDIDCEITQELADLQFWNRIESMSASLVGNVTQGLNRISQKLISINEIKAVPDSWPDQYTPLSVWRNLYKIELSCDPIYLISLELPTLDSLILSDRRNWNVDYALEAFPRVSYPLLKYLKITTSGPRWLSKVSAPLIKEFSIESRATLDESEGWGLGGDHSSLFTGFTFLEVTELTFGARCPSGAVISGLKHFSNIQKLHLLFSSKIPILALLVQLGNGTHSLCPQLTHLCLGHEDSWVNALKKDIVPEVKRLIKFRKRIGMPLDHLSIYWHRGLGVAQSFI